jgi:hypothetical protein
MRLIALLILSSISTAFLASCVQSDEEYFKQLKREGISQEPSFFLRWQSLLLKRALFEGG